MRIHAHKRGGGGGGGGVWTRMRQAGGPAVLGLCGRLGDAGASAAASGRRGE